MKTYRLSQDFIRAVIRRIWWVYALVIILVISAIVVGNFYAYQESGMIYWEAIILEVVMTMAVIAGSVFFNIRSQQSILRSIRIELGEDGISRSQLRIPPVHIARAEIAEIRTMGKGLCVQSVDKYRNLAILTGLVDENGAPADAEIRATLESWSPIKPAPASLNVKAILLNVAVLAAIIVIYFAQQIWIVLPLWLALVGYLLYGLIQLRHYQGVDPRYRRNLTLTYGILIFLTGLKIFAYNVLPVLSGLH